MSETTYRDHACRDHAWKISAYVDGELSAEEREGIEEHLESCPACRLMAKEFRVLEQLGARRPVASISPEEWRETLLGVTERAQDSRKQDSRKVVRLPGRRLVIAASAVAAALLVGFLLARAFISGPGDGPRPAERGVAGGQSDPPKAAARTATRSPDADGEVAEPSGRPPGDRPSGDRSLPAPRNDR